MDKNRELHELLGLCWHEITGYVGNEIPSCSCGENLYGNTVHKNPDFTSDAGKVQLLREMMLKCKDWDGFVDRIGVRIGGQAYFHHAFILNTNGLCRDQAIVWLKRDERTD